MAATTFRLRTIPDKSHPLGWRSYTLGSTITQASTVRGSTSDTIYGLQPAMFIRKAIDAAKDRMRFLQLVDQYTLPSGNETIFIPRRKNYMVDSDWETSSAEYTTADTAIAWTDINTMDSQQATPTNYNYGVNITNDAIRKTGIPLISYCQEELSYKFENSVDNAIRDAICGTVVADAAGTGTEPTEQGSAAVGTQTIFGGDATDADNSIDTGDVLTPEMLLKAKRLLMSKKGYYYTGNVWTASSATYNTNPWSEDEGFVAVVAPAQWESLIQDSTFLSAAEYGGREAVLRGEIKNFAGIRIVVTDKCPDFSDGESYTVTNTETDADVEGHICVMVKPKKCGAIVWGRNAEFKTWDYPDMDAQRMKLSMAYAVTEIFPDAIVRMIVSDA